MMEYSVTRGMEALTLDWISQSSGIQRRGRCGRVKPGVAFAFYTQDFMATRRVHELPEILQLSLEKTILQIKALFPLVPMVSIMRDLVEPPDMTQLEQSFSRLVSTGAVTQSVKSAPAAAARHIVGVGKVGAATLSDSMDGQVTFFGKLASHMPCDIVQSRVVLTGMSLTLALFNTCRLR